MSGFNLPQAKRVDIRIVSLPVRESDWIYSPTHSLFSWTNQKYFRLCVSMDTNDVWQLLSEKSAIITVFLPSRNKVREIFSDRAIDGEVVVYTSSTEEPFIVNDSGGL